jgi:hypothetical protein
MDIAAIINDIGLPLIAVIVPLIVAAFKKVVPDIPSFLLPVIAPVLGAGGGLLLAWLASVPGGGWKGAAAGLAGVGVRELVDQLKKALPAASPPRA